MDNKKTKLIHLLLLQILSLFMMFMTVLFWETLMNAFMSSTREEAMPYYREAESYLPYILFLSLILWVDIIYSILKTKKNINWTSTEIILFLAMNLLIIKSIGFDKHEATFFGRIAAYIFAGHLLITLCKKIRLTKEDRGTIP